MNIRRRQQHEAFTMTAAISGRWLMAAGGLFALLLTPPFALSYYSAYPMPDESPPMWLVAVRPLLTDAGLLEPGSAAVYDRYGLLYLGAWLIGIAGLVGVLTGQWHRFGRGVRRAWGVCLACFIIVAVGIFGDYGLPDEVGSLAGFAATGIGLFAAAVSLPFLGRALRRELGVPTRAAWGIALLGVVSIFGGLLLVGHIPSGPCVGFVAVAFVTGLTRPWRTPPRAD